MKTTTKWIIDQTHSEVSFKVRHLMISYLKGTFRSFDASIYTTGVDFSTAVIDVWIDSSSISTGDSKRDEHLKSYDFLNVKRYLQMGFTASNIGNMDAYGNHELLGELTIVGITQKVKLNAKFGGAVKDLSGSRRVGFEISGSINRKEWGLVWNTPIESGGLMVGEDVTISCEIELVEALNNDMIFEIADFGKLSEDGKSKDE